MLSPTSSFLGLFIQAFRFMLSVQNWTGFMQRKIIIQGNNKDKDAAFQGFEIAYACAAKLFIDFG